MSVETRWVVREGKKFPESLNQEAISWCVTHDSQVSKSQLGCRVAMVADMLMIGLTDMTADCVISTGGPDHKWWQDE